MVIKINKLFLLLLTISVLIISCAFIMKSATDNSTASGEVYIRVPVIMYHHVTRDKEKAGNYTVTTEELESDLSYLKSKGYSAVTPKDLIDYVNSDVSLPEKPILLTFDDGFESYYALAKPLFEKHNMKSSVYIIGDAADLYTRVCDHNISYSNLNWDHIKELVSSPLFEVGSHTYDLHHNEKGERKGMSRLDGESVSEYYNVIITDLKKLQNRFTKYGIDAPVSIAYPYGAYDEHTKSIVKQAGFKVSFTCEERINRIAKGNEDCLYNLGRYNRVSGISTQEFFSKIINQE